MWTKQRLSRLGRQAIESYLVPPLRYLHEKVSLRTTVPAVVTHRAIMRSADYAEAHMARAARFYEREKLWELALSRAPKDGLRAEFGVWNGYSINYMAKRIEGPIYGFDSFEGLHVEWSSVGLGKGMYSRKGVMPKVASNVTLVKGWFDQTIPGFLAEHPENFAFVHVDCDTYEATQILFNCIGSRIAVGTVIVFDEYFGMRSWELDEFRAWQEFVAEKKIAYEYFGFAKEQVAIRVNAIG